MKKILIVLLSLSFLGTALAQDGNHDYKSDLKRAKKYLSKYIFDQTANVDKLPKAAALMDGVVNSEDYKMSNKAWTLRGKIYNEMAARDEVQLQLNPNYEIKDPEVAIKAYKSFMMTYDNAVKKYHKKDALKGLRETARYLNSIGYALYGRKNFDAAYENFNDVLKIDELLKANDKKPVFSKEEDLLNEVYIAGIAAMSGNRSDDMKKHFENLLSKGYDKPAVYQGLFNYYLDKDQAKAEKYLTQGRAKYPEETSLLFAEINYYLKKGELSKLVDKLKLARKKEPNNVSIVVTEANVYDNIYQKSLDSNDVETAAKYFDMAKTTYEDALEMDPKNFIATYSIGALYYNKAASVLKEVNALADDFSKDGMKKYEAKKAEMDGYFDQALPYFEKAIAINPKDRNTLIALKEIYARKNMMDKSMDCKKKLDALSN